MSPLYTDSSTIIIYLTSIIVSIAFMIRWYKSKYSYWSKLGIPGPTPLPFFGNALAEIWEPLDAKDIKYQKKYGNVYGIYEFFTPILMISDVNIVKTVLVKEFSSFPVPFPEPFSSDIMDTKNIGAITGKEWKRLRAIISTCFSSAKMKKMMGMLKDCTENMNVALLDIVSGGGHFNSRHFFGQLSLDMQAKACFAIDSETILNKNNEFVVHSKKFFNFSALNMMLLKTLPEFLAKLFRIEFNDKNSRNFFKSIVKYLIQKRKSSPGSHEDILKGLMDAQQENSLKPDERPLDEDEVLVNSIIFLAAGYTTTATLMTYCCHELASNPKVQEKLYQEINGSFKGSDDITYEVLTKLPYLDAVIKETLRKNGFARNFRVSEGCRLEELNIYLPKYQQVYILNSVIHMDPENYEEPEKFKPERFLPENADRINPNAFLPFSSGPRICPASRLAYLMAKLVVAELLLNYKLLKSPKTRGALKKMSGDYATDILTLNLNVQKRI